MNIAAHYYNASLQWNKGRQEAILNTSVRRPVAVRPFFWILSVVSDTLDPQPWQTDTCIGDWHYKTDIGYCEANTIVPMLVDIVSKNGNLLLNIPLRSTACPMPKKCRSLNN